MNEDNLFQQFEHFIKKHENDYDIDDAITDEPHYEFEEDFLDFDVDNQKERRYERFQDEHIPY